MDLRKTFFGLVLVVVSILFLGCGYKPATLYTSKVLGNKIYVEVVPDIEEPQNTLYIKDAFREVIVHRLNAIISPSKELADTVLDVNLESIDFAAIQYDEQGYTVAYKATVKLRIKYNSSKKSGIINSDGTFDFPIDSNSVISENKKNEAIKVASTKAITKFISKMSSF